MYIMYIQLWHEAQPPKVPSAVARASVPTPYGTGFHWECPTCKKCVPKKNKLSFQRTAETHVVPRPRIIDDETAAHRWWNLLKFPIQVVSRLMFSWSSCPSTCAGSHPSSNSGTKNCPAAGGGNARANTCRVTKSVGSYRSSSPRKGVKLHVHCITNRFCSSLVL
jgi:hypothetical protein